MILIGTATDIHDIWENINDINHLRAYSTTPTYVAKFVWVSLKTFQNIQFNQRIKYGYNLDNYNSVN